MCMLFLFFQASLSPLASSRPICLFHWSVIYYSCHLGLIVLPSVCQFFAALVVGLSSFYLDSHKWPSTMTKFKILFIKVEMEGKFWTCYLTDINHSHIPLHPKFQFFFSVHSAKFWSRTWTKYQIFFLRPYSIFKISIFLIWNVIFSFDIIVMGIFEQLIWFIIIFLLDLIYENFPILAKLLIHLKLTCPLLCNEIL